MGNDRPATLRTRQLLVAFDSEKPTERSSDFLAVTSSGASVGFFGLSSGKDWPIGLVVYLGKEIKAQDLFAKLVDAGLKIESVEETLRMLEDYIQQLQSFRIGNVLTLEADQIAGFKLRKVADSPSSAGHNRLP